jgi:hypothetical protein
MSGHHICFYLAIRPTIVCDAGRDPSRQNTGRREETMNEELAHRHHDAGRYEIRLQGHLHSRWAAWFDGMTVTNSRDGTTIIHGPVADQAALHGLLQKVRDLGLPLISVNQVDLDQSDVPRTSIIVHHFPQRNPK